MKENLFRMLRSGVAILLAFCMVVGLVPTTVFAEEAPAKKYVSLGDSMTNGFGLGNGYDSTGNQGYLEVCTVAYPALVASHFEWDLTQLATSGLRSEDLYRALDYGAENAYPDEIWVENGWFDFFSWNVELAEAAKVYQTAVTEADVITMAVGNANFGVHMVSIMNSALSIPDNGHDHSFATLENAFAIVEADEQTRTLVTSIHNSLLAYLNGVLPNELVEKVAGCMAFVVASYLMSYEGALDRIVELNPDVQLIIIGLMNTMSGFAMDVVYQGEEYHLDGAEMLDLILNPLNAYLAGLPAAKMMSEKYVQTEIYYAELDRIETLANTYKEDYAANEAFYLSRFVPDITGELFPEINLPVLKAEDVLAYRNAVHAAGGTEAYVANLTVKYLQEGKAKDQNEAVTMATADVTPYEAYNLLETAILNAMEKTPFVNLDELTELKDSLNSNFELPDVLGVLLDDTFIDENGTLNPGALEDDVVVALLNLYGRLELGQGMPAHPSKKAHLDMSEEIIAAYGNHTAMDETMENAMEAAKIIGGLVVEYYDDVYAGFQKTETYWDATHTYMLSNENPYYVAIGDGTAMSDSYVEKLAKELNVSYKNLAENGMLIADTYDLLEEQKSEIEKADIITVGFGANSFVNFAVDNIGNGIFTGKFAELDWASVVGESNVPKVEQAMASVYEELAAKELGTIEIFGKSLDMAQLMTVAVESFAYAAASYAVELPQVIDAIYEINEEADILIVGMYNPVKDVNLVMGEGKLELGKYVDYLVEVANLRNLTYAVQTGRATFVEAKEVETQNTNSELDVVGFLFQYLDIYGVHTGEETNPSDKGHEYIKTYIRDALIFLNPVEIEMSRMILGNELALQFAFKQAPFVEGVSYTAVITKKDKVIEVPQSEWKTTSSGGESSYYISFNGIAAKEMSEDVSVQIMVGDVAVSDVYTDSVRDYALRQLRKTNDAVTKTLYVDMLNYGAAAQSYFGYDAENLANADLTTEEKAYATKTVDLEGKAVAGTNYVASQLNLESSIQLRAKFKNIDSSMYAVVRFTNHAGREIEVKVEGTEFLYSGTVVVVDAIVAADYAQDVTVTVYNANGEAVATAVDSVANYIGRMTGGNAIYDAIAKYCASAHAYLHRNDNK